MDHANPDLFDAATPPSPAQRAAALAPPASSGHYDELRGGLSGQQAALAWSTFFEQLGHEGFADLNHRAHSLARQIRDNGVSYNVYSDASGPQRPWSLDLFPLIVTPESWSQIEAGVLQRVRVLERVMADVYGPQELLKAGLLPPALVQGHPGYLRPMHGVAPVGGTHLHIAAFDLARGPDGNWWVISQRTQAPSGLGYLLENRISISRQFAPAFEGMHIQRLAATYRALIESLKQMSPAGADSHIALLTPGPYNETYFEHAYLARYLGLTLVEGSDLTVRDQKLYLKTLRGLEPVHGLLKRLDDEFLDPLELRPDSTLGVPGLLQAIRAGNVLVANAPGSAFLESSALLGFLPALAKHLLGEELSLPALPTWWCGERAGMEDVLPRLGECVIKPTYPGAAGGFEAVLGRTLTRSGLDEWAGRILRAGDLHTVQSYLPPSQMPTWQDERIVPRSVMLRVFAIADGPQSWRVLPGGLARLVNASAGMASMQRGGSSADTWVMTHGEVDRTTLLSTHHATPILTQRKRLVTSRAAENLYWLGRYTERTENNIRLARLTLDSLNGQDPCSPALLSWLSELAVRNTLVLPDVPTAQQARRVFERSLIASLGSHDMATSVGYTLRALKLAAAAVRERLSQEQWNIITRAEAEMTQCCAEQAAQGDYSAVEALRALEAASSHLAAITGAQTDRMTRDDGWRLLSIGRQIERLCFLAPALAGSFESGAVHDDGGFEALIALFDSTITFHAQYQQSREVPALLDLLVLDRDNPRSLGWVVQTLRGRLAKLAGCPAGEMDALAQMVPDPERWDLQALCQAREDGILPQLAELLTQCNEASWRVSDEISLRYFTHTGESGQSLGA
ncbi:circularly permuted type 2 ATP-grasp protein [Rhodoferax sp. BAB1]|uniref:circularly permuted type 2 ATP-grasp protein n=1 Tax=Rhodoferax sp. BAB1 TaxID=2741720 RepID=UPI001576CE75|nr:circularly permuted type 2 ATP-grasp protein [Rhodoferax sp. BAB1]QKO21296.1 circularly permuted type 2 ATP-grasp protein [Rhodoferax sp. BAB1]